MYCASISYRLSKRRKPSVDSEDLCHRMGGCQTVAHLDGQTNNYLSHFAASLDQEGPFQGTHQPQSPGNDPKNFFSL
jgi:hypothetical protein